MCTALPNEVAAGSCDISEATPGTDSFTVRATGALGHLVEEVVVVDVHAPFSAAFTVSATDIDYGQSVILSWTTIGAAQISLTANGEELLDGNEPLDEGSPTHSPQGATTYVFTATAPDGRTRTISHAVVVRTFHFDVWASTTEVMPGTPVTIGWNVTSLTGEAPTIRYDWPLVEVTDGSAAFEDITTLGATQVIGPGQDTTQQTVNFPSGFVLPYFGNAYTAVRVTSDGFLSFNLSASSLATNARLPSTSNGNVHLAVFWDDLLTQSGGVYAAFLPHPDRFVIPWSHVGRYHSLDPRTYDLNFQVVLFPDGAFEFRYGTMAPPPSGSSSCSPTSDCAGDANGASATIGYQARWAMFSISAGRARDRATSPSPAASPIVPSAPSRSPAAVRSRSTWGRKTAPT